MEKAVFTMPVQEKKPANSQRADMINQVLKFMGEDNFGKWLGLTKHLSPGEIHTMMNQSQEGRNPRELFWWYLRESKK